MPAWLALLLTDFGVNAGTGTAVRLLQRILEQDVDGILGKNSMAAVQRAVADPNNQLCQDYVAGQRAYYQNLAANKPSQQSFLKGWLNQYRMNVPRWPSSGRKHSSPANTNWL
jgi:lysozyme family protein